MKVGSASWILGKSVERHLVITIIRAVDRRRARLLLRFIVANNPRRADDSPCSSRYSGASRFTVIRSFEATATCRTLLRHAAIYRVPSDTFTFQCHEALNLQRDGM